MVTAIGEDRRVDLPRPTVPALLQRSAREFGGETYVVTPTERLSYKEAEQRSAHLARCLLSSGVGKGSRVGLFFANGIEWIIWWLAVSRIGALAVPLSTLYAPAELAKVVRLADIGLLAAPSRVLNIDVVERLETAFPELAGQTSGRLSLVAAPFLRRVVVTDSDSDRSWVTRWGADGDAAVPQDVLAAVEDEVSPADLAVMVHTSGSTADPKGVMHTHGTLVRQTSTWPGAIRSVTGSEASARILCAMPFFWIGGLLATTGALHEPVTLLVMPRLDAGTALDLVESERATGIVGWPAFTQRLREHPTFARRDLSSAPMLRDGPLDIAMTDVPDGFPCTAPCPETAGGFAFTEMNIVDEDGAPVPDGNCRRAPCSRHRGDGGIQQARTLADTFDEDGWYHTADRVYRKEGDPRLFYVGRTSELIKAAGANVSPLEVESVIEQFADVRSAWSSASTTRCGAKRSARCGARRRGLRRAIPGRRTRDHLSAYKIPTRWALATSDQIPDLAERQAQPEGCSRAHRRRHVRSFTDPAVGGSVGPGDVGERIRVVIGVGQRPSPLAGIAP